MSYARWSSSNWYAFHSASSGKDRNSQVLALWHRRGSKTQMWRYDDLCEVDAAWVRKQYGRPIKRDVDQALAIIAEFRADVEAEYPSEEGRT